MRVGGRRNHVNREGEINMAPRGRRPWRVIHRYVIATRETLSILYKSMTNNPNRKKVKRWIGSRITHCIVPMKRGNACGQGRR